MTFLAKIQNEKYIQDMYENEYLYFKPLKEFRSTRNDPTGRLDPKELNLKNEPLSYLSVKIGDDEIVLSNLPNFNAQFMEHLDDPKINCCSLYTVDVEFDGPPPSIDDRCLEMGNKMLLIYNLKAF